MNSIAGRSMIGSNYFGTVLVAGRNLVPNPAAGITAIVARSIFDQSYRLVIVISPKNVHGSTDSCFDINIPDLNGLDEIKC